MVESAAKGSALSSGGLDEAAQAAGVCRGGTTEIFFGECEVGHTSEMANTMMIVANEISVGARGRTPTNRE